VNTLVPLAFALTPAEVVHVRHYVWDVYHATDRDYTAGPATKWLWDNDIFPTTMQPFQLAAQHSIPGWHTWLSEPPPTPFRPAWTSKEEFEARAWEALESYPEMKGLGSALPGYHPQHSLVTSSSR
jgi:hypothetical protein